MNTYRDLITHVLIPAATICALAWLIDRAATRAVNAMVDDGLAALAAEVDVYGPAAMWGPVERADAEQRLRDWNEHVTSAFDEAMSGRPHLAEIRARQEAARLDDEWAAWMGEQR